MSWKFSHWKKNGFRFFENNWGWTLFFYLFCRFRTINVYNESELERQEAEYGQDAPAGGSRDLAAHEGVTDHVRCLFERERKWNQEDQDQSSPRRWRVERNFPSLFILIIFFFSVNCPGTSACSARVSVPVCLSHKCVIFLTPWHFHSSQASKSSPRAEHPNQKKRNDKSGHGKGASKPQTLQAAIKSLNQETLEKALNQSKKAFPNSTLLWLKDLASYLNVHFEEVRPQHEWSPAYITDTFAEFTHVFTSVCHCVCAWLCHCVCAWVCPCMCAWEYAHACEYAHVCACKSMPICVCVQICPCVCACKCAYVCARARLCPCVCACESMPLCVRMRDHAHLSVCKSMPMCVGESVPVCESCEHTTYVCQFCFLYRFPSKIPCIRTNGAIFPLVSCPPPSSKSWSGLYREPPITSLKSSSTTASTPWLQIWAKVRGLCAESTDVWWSHFFGKYHYNQFASNSWGKSWYWCFFRRVLASPWEGLSVHPEHISKPWEWHTSTQADRQHASDVWNLSDLLSNQNLDFLCGMFGCFRKTTTLYLACVSLPPLSLPFLFLLQTTGLSIYGYQIAVQLLAYMSPAIVLGDLSKYSELLSENQGRPLRCLSILWALGQCGLKVVRMEGVNWWFTQGHYFDRCGHWILNQWATSTEFHGDFWSKKIEVIENRSKLFLPDAHCLKRDQQMDRSADIFLLDNPLCS